MIGFTVKVERIQDIVKILEKYPDAVRLGLEDATVSLRNLVQGATPVGIGPTEGEMKGSWSTVTYEAGGFSFGSDKPYAEVLEEGLYPGVGPRTVKTGEGIFSRQAPGGMVAPLIEDDTVVDRLLELIVEQIERGFQSAGT